MNQNSATLPSAHARPRRHQGVHDVVVVGGGLVGSAIAYGLAQTLPHVAVLDEGDIAYRASRGNFGLVWVQSKGMGMPAYGHWTMASQGLWQRLADALRDETGVDVCLEQRGGLHVVLSDEEYEAREAFMTRLQSQPGMAQYPWKMLDRQAVADLVPGLGPEVRGASWTPVDGIANPLKLLRALHTAFDRRGVDYLPHHPAQQVAFKDGVFEVATPHGIVRGAKLLLASGLGNRILGAQVGLDIPVRPQRGQIIALERTRRILETPLVSLRQMDEGTWLIGDSQEEMGYEDRTTGLPVLATLADRAVRTLPALRDVRAVRAWAALRVMSADGFPIYEQSATHPGAFVATCHSGVTLAAAHAYRYAPMVAAGALDEGMSSFSTRRFHVQKAA
jgi:glycine/D-amino acid oxidase-like deaminating enzyme